MKKILFCIESLCGGGAEKVFTTLLKHIDKSKFDITVLLVTETGIYVDEVKKYCNVKSMLPDYNKLNNFFDKIKYKLDYKFIYSADSKKVYKKYIRKEYDVEIAFIEGFATKLIANSPNKSSKKYAWVHTDLINNPWTEIVYESVGEERKCYKKFDKVFCVSSNVKDAFDKKYNTNNSLVQYNPVDEKEIIQKSKEFTVYKQADLQLVTLGRLVPQKGYDRLLRCVKKLKDQGYNSFHIWILGDGIEKEELEKYIDVHGLRKFVTLLGFKENPYPYIAASDGFICSSRSEGFSTVATESLILGKPIYTVDCAGMKEIFDDIACGIIVNNDQDSLYKLLKIILMNENNFLIGIQKRQEYFLLDSRIKEIENLLI